LQPRQGQIDVQTRRSAQAQLFGPRLAVPVPSFAPVPSETGDPALAEEADDAAAIPGQPVPGSRNVTPPIGRQRPGPSPTDEVRPRGDRLVPLSGDLEFGIQRREAGYGHRAFYEQQLQLNRDPGRRRADAESAGEPSAARRGVERIAGRWWFQRRTGEWLVYDERTARWRPFHPGEFGGAQ
jgi:hypothetical protein